jgi:hypothetical protein
MPVVASFNSTNTFGGSLQTFSPADTSNLNVGGVNLKNNSNAFNVVDDIPASISMALSVTVYVAQQRASEYQERSS